jgi:hypothetical protein
MESLRPHTSQDMLENLLELSMIQSGQSSVIGVVDREQVHVI